jgi:hypothetical protein
MPAGCHQSISSAVAPTRVVTPGCPKVTWIIRGVIDWCFDGKITRVKSGQPYRGAHDGHALLRPRPAQLVRFRLSLVVAVQVAFGSKGLTPGYHLMG